MKSVRILSKGVRWHWRLANTCWRKRAYYFTLWHLPQTTCNSLPVAIGVAGL